MPRFNTLVLTGLLIALSGAHLATAQTQAVSHLAVQSGNGQVACLCVSSNLLVLQPISVKATDVNGNPVAGATITWTVTSGQVTLDSPTTITGGNGISTNPLSLTVFNNFSSSSVPYLVATIQAATNNNTAIFTETESLITDQGSSVIAATNPTLDGLNLGQANLTAKSGTQFTSAIQTPVTGTGPASNGVANVSVRLFNNQTSPTLTCAYPGGYADPGSVLSDPRGNTNCFPVFGGSGTGTFYVLVGGVAGSGTDIATAKDLQQFGPYTFTSFPGNPVALQIVSGNNQVGNSGQPLSPLVAKLVDADGNAVQNKTVTWTVFPAGAVALSNTTTQTDNAGLVTNPLSLFLPAQNGAQITLTLQSNPSITVTFQETLAGTVTRLDKISGDAQNAQVGTNFSKQLIVQVNGANGPVKGYPVQFISNGPVGIQGPTTVSTDTNGQAAITVKAGTLTGTATVTAVVGILNQTFNLTITSTPNAPPPNGLSKLGGDTQTAIVNAGFPLAVVVQVNSTAGPVAGYPVTFSTNGPVTLSAYSVNTGANGQAQVNVIGGSVAGAATVTAAITGFTQTFTFTVLPLGPSVTANSFLNAASRQVGSLSPCSLATISAAGLTPDGISALSVAPIFGRLPLSVHNLSVNFNGVLAPIVNVAMGPINPEVTVQVPCEVLPATSVPVTVNVGGGSATSNISVQTVSPGIFETVMSDGVKRAVVVRDDGTFADIGTAFPNPARRGENLRLFVTGLGLTIPSVGTNSIQNPNADLIGRDATVAGAVQVGISGLGGVQVISARQAPDLIGVYEIQFFLPSNAPTGNDVVISVGIIPLGGSSSSQAVQSLGSKIPIQ